MHQSTGRKIIMLSQFQIKKIKRDSVIKNLIRFSLLTGLMLLCRHAFAADGTDLLAGTDVDLIQTVKGTGKKYIYIAELIIASIGFIKTRNPTVFAGILALSVGFNVLLKVAGV